MKTIRFSCCGVWLWAISACTPFYRGFEGSTLKFPRRPDVSVSVVDMPMLARHGRIARSLNTDRATGSRNPCLRVPERTRVSRSHCGPFLCAQQRLRLGPAHPLQRAYGQQGMGTVFGGESFYGSVRIVNGAKDPFAPLFAPEDQLGFPPGWLVQRFAVPGEFRPVKHPGIPRTAPRVAQGRFRSAGIQRGCAGVPRTGGQGVPRPEYGEAPMPKDEGPYIGTAQCPLYGELPRQACP